MTLVAHVFLAPYTLPVPFWMYLYGCAATIILSFALVAYLASGPDPGSLNAATTDRSASPPTSRLWSWVVSALRSGAVAVLAITVLTGLAGPTDPGSNLGMTCFWVYFLLAFAYVTVLIGDIYRWINPWNTLAEAVRGCGIDMDRERLRYADQIAYWPAVVAYVALVWIELFALPKPSTLAFALVAYTAITLSGMYVFGRTVWLRYGELFAVFFRVLGSLAPVEYVHDGSSDGRPRPVFRWPLAGALTERAEHPSLIAFILFMLSSTTYDAVHETYLWISLYWQRLLPALLPILRTDVGSAQAALTTGYWWYQRLGLIAAPVFYFVWYLAVLWTALLITRTAVSLRTLSATFAFSLVPIAVAYHATHYVPSMLRQLPAVLPQLADPFARGWQLLPVEMVPPAPIPMSVLWHAQVVVLLVGHIAGVYLAHVAALRVFTSRQLGIVSQLPMLFLMVGYTCLGLWILSLPLGVPQLVPSAG